MSTPISTEGVKMPGMSIGRRLRELRIGRQLTLEQAAKVAGTTRQYVSQLEKGKNQTPNGVMLEAWARFYGVSHHWLASGLGARAISAQAASGSSPMANHIAGLIDAITDPALQTRAFVKAVHAVESLTTLPAAPESQPEPQSRAARPAHK